MAESGSVIILKSGDYEKPPTYEPKMMTVAQNPLCKYDKNRVNYYYLRIINFFLDKGLTVNQSCAIAGNAMVESWNFGFSQDMCKDTTGNSFGLFMMNTGGVLPSYKSWCKQNGRSWSTIDAQLEYSWILVKEGKLVTRKDLYNYYTSDEGKNASMMDLVWGWMHNYERCSECISESYKGGSNNKKRTNFANDARRLFDEKKYSISVSDSVIPVKNDNVDNQKGLTPLSGDASEMCKRFINNWSALRGSSTPYSTDTLGNYLQSLSDALSSVSSPDTTGSSNENADSRKVEAKEWLCVGEGHEIESVKSILFECFKESDENAEYINKFYKLPYKIKTFSMDKKINCKYLVFSIPWTYYVEFFETVSRIIGDKDPGPQNRYKEEHKTQFKNAFKKVSGLLYKTCYSNFIRDNITYKYMYIIPSTLEAMNIKRTLCAKLRNEYKTHDYLCYDFVGKEDFLRYMYDIIEHAILEIVKKDFNSYLLFTENYNLYERDHSKDLKKKRTITHSLLLKAKRLQDEPKFNCSSPDCKNASEEAYQKKFLNLLKLFNPLYKEN